MNDTDVVSHTPIRLVVSDLDGTLIDDNAEIPSEIESAVQALLEHEAFFTLATGRTYAGTERFARRLNVNAPLILYQGGEIRDPWSAQLLHQETIPLDTAHQFVEATRRLELHINVYVDDCTYTARPTPESDFYAKLGGIQVYPVGDLIAFLDRPPTKVLIIADEQRITAIRPGLTRDFKGRLEIVRSHRLFLEAVPVGVNKSKGLSWLAKHLNIDRQHISAIGDNDNDVEMIAYAGLGIAMGNASKAVKAVADIIAPPIQESGAAWAMRNCILPRLAGRY